MYFLIIIIKKKQTLQDLQPVIKFWTHRSERFLNTSDKKTQKFYEITKSFLSYLTWQNGYKDRKIQKSYFLIRLTVIEEKFNNGRSSFLSEKKKTFWMYSKQIPKEHYEMRYLSCSFKNNEMWFALLKMSDLSCSF